MIDVLNSMSVPCVSFSPSPFCFLVTESLLFLQPLFLQFPSFLVPLISAPVPFIQSHFFCLIQSQSLFSPLSFFTLLMVYKLDSAQSILLYAMADLPFLSICTIAVLLFNKGEVYKKCVLNILCNFFNCS